ncbi:MAG: stalk domain-containing protein [Defluviitaleaceae bacterium]|nr:stalk domain-containing protein [Defluviitaleaceae bacterium]
MKTNKLCGIANVLARSIFSILVVSILIFSSLPIGSMSVQAMQSPTITTPWDNQTVPHANLAVSGNNPAGGAVYIHLRDVNNDRRIDLGSGTGYGGHRISDWGHTFSFTIPQNRLAPETKYRLAVESRGDGQSTWDAIYFTVEALQRPTITTPHENQYVYHANLTVSGNNPAGGAVYIHLRDLNTDLRVDLGSGTGYGGHRISNGGNTFSFTIPQNRLTPGTRYRLFVDTRLVGHAAGSHNRYFTVHAAAPLPNPTITRPSENQTVPHANLTVSGNNPAGGAVYIHLRDLNNDRRVDLGSGIGYEGHRIASSGNTFSFTIPQNRLTPGTNYQLAIESRRDGQNAWAELRRFTVDDPSRQGNYEITVDSPIGRGNTIIVSYGANIILPNIVIHSSHSNLRAVTVTIPHHGDDIQATRLTNQGREVSLNNRELRTYSGNRRLPVGFHRVNIWARNVDDETAGEIVCYFYVRVVQAGVSANEVTAPYGQAQTPLNGNVRLDYNGGDLRLMRFQIAGGYRDMCTMDNDNGVRWQPSPVREIGHFNINTAGLQPGNYTIVVWAQVSTGMRSPSREYTSIRAGEIPLTITGAGGGNGINCANLNFPSNRVPRGQTNRIIIHHTVTHTNGAAGVRAIHNSHISGNGWNGIGYNYVIDQNGEIWLGRGRRYVGAHVGGHNWNSIGIGLIGRFHENGNRATQAQMDSLRWLINDIQRQHGSLGLYNHGQLEANQCPGRYFLVHQWNDLVRWHRPNISATAFALSAAPSLELFATLPLEYEAPYGEAAMQADIFDTLPVGAGFVSVVSNDWQRGDVSIAHDSAEVVFAGTEIGISAISVTGYEFVRWDVSEGDVVIANPNSPETNFIATAGQVAIRAVFQEARNSQVQPSTEEQTGQTNQTNQVGRSDTTTPAVENISGVFAYAPESVRSLRFAIGTVLFTNNGHHAIGDAAPFIDSGIGRTMVPLRAISEGLGATVDWNNATRTVIIVREGTTLNISVDAPLPDGMGVPAIVNGRTFVPVRYVSEMLGADVRWDSGERAVYVNLP